MNCDTISFIIATLRLPGGPRARRNSSKPARLPALGPRAASRPGKKQTSLQQTCPLFHHFFPPSLPPALLVPLRLAASVVRGPWAPLAWWEAGRTQLAPSILPPSSVPVQDLGRGEEEFISSLVLSSSLSSFLEIIDLHPFPPHLSTFTDGKRRIAGLYLFSILGPFCPTWGGCLDAARP